MCCEDRCLWLKSLYAHQLLNVEFKVLSSSPLLYCFFMIVGVSVKIRIAYPVSQTPGDGWASEMLACSERWEKGLP